MKVHTALLLPLALLVAVPAAADEHRGERWRGRDHARSWHGGDIHRFHERDARVWRGGYWHHGRHLGRSGWWWVVGNSWYFYPRPVYPYPDPYQPPVVVAPVTPVVPVAPAPPPSQFWYYCDNPPGYYPYVAQCATPWRPVPAEPR